MSTFAEFKKDISGKLKKELSPDLHYHGWHHTMEVYNNAVEIAKSCGIKATEMRLLKVAVLLHDAGFVKVYDGHEEEGCKIAKKILPKYNFIASEINIVCGMIRATKIPQQPKTLLEQIIADADLLYLGTDKFISLGNGLRQERDIYFGTVTDKAWEEFQISFIEKHSFHTAYCLKSYEATKQKNLKLLRKKLEKHK